MLDIRLIPEFRENGTEQFFRKTKCEFDEDISCFIKNELRPDIRYPALAISFKNHSASSKKNRITFSGKLSTQKSVYKMGKTFFEIFICCLHECINQFIENLCVIFKFF